MRLNREDEHRPDGRLYRLGPDNRLSCMDEGYAVANGPAIRGDGQLMLHTDSVRRIVYAFDMDAAAGTVTNRRVWREFGEADGHPDGMTFDADDHVWIAHWGAGMVCRYDPAGRHVRTVPVPAVNVTNVCFFGPASDRLAISTAALSGWDDTRGDGAVFELLSPGTRGCA